MALVSKNPASGEIIQCYDEATDGQLADSIENAHNAFSAWRRSDWADRTALLKRVAQGLRQKCEDYSRLMALEMGKSIQDGRAEIEKCAWVCDYYAEHGAGMLAPEVVPTDATKSYVVFEPLGVLLAVMPWNYPFWQVFRFAAPGLMAGNAVLLKHASNVSGCSQAIEAVFSAAGSPRGLFQSLLVSSQRIEMVLKNPLVQGVSLTGSSLAGKAVAGMAGKQMKKTVFELGGSDPYLILEDAPLAQAVEACVTSRLLNSGQSCIAAKRFIVVAPVREAFETKLVQLFGQKKMGDPLDASVQIGPLARCDLRDDLHRQVEQSIQQGARCLMGGQIPDSPGAFYPITVLTDIAKGMPVYDEETFGPVAAVIVVADEKEAIRVANDTPYGLGAAVFTSDIQRGERIAREELQAGTCCVNTFVRSDPRLPFGGIKQSGVGRELSHYGIKEFVNIKTIYIK